MRTLIYKRTHPGDPDRSGEFGVYDCMGRVRSWSFDAVIGVGGMGSEPRSYRLDGKVNWIGIGAHKRHTPNARGPLVTFDHFRFYGDRGPDFERLAPVLAQRMYSRNVRLLMALSSEERAEVSRILALAKTSPPSAARSSRKGGGRRQRCARKNLSLTIRRD